MKKINQITLIASSIAMLLSSCSSEKMEEFLHPMVKAPASSIERDVKGHDQIYSVQVILRLATKRTKDQAYTAYGIPRFKETSLPLYQEIDITKDDNGNMKITSERKAFDVVKSSKYYYGLELKYYDLNGKLINHQFSHYDEKDPENSTLLHHQHFFSLHNYSLNGQQLLFPMTLDSIYYDEYVFQTDMDNKRMPSTVGTPVNVYVPADNATDGRVRYNPALAQHAIETTMKPESTNDYVFPQDNKRYRLYKALDPSKLNDKVKDIFKYEYRDTDPVEEELFGKIKGNDDLNRIRLGKNVSLLQQRRDLGTANNPDHLGFKGMLQFLKSNMIFQMRICISHMVTSTEKYITPNGTRGIREYNQISPAWNNYDIDYPIAFRVIADADGDGAQFYQDIKKIYPNAQEADLKEMFSGEGNYFRHVPQVNM